jgi:hypothetical protein
MQKKTGTQNSGTHIRPEYPSIYRVVLTSYTTRIRNCTIWVLLVSIPDIKIPESTIHTRYSTGIPDPFSPLLAIGFLYLYVDGHMLLNEIDIVVNKLCDNCGRSMWFTIFYKFCDDKSSFKFGGSRGTMGLGLLLWSRTRWLSGKKVLIHIAIRFHLTTT